MKFFLDTANLEQIETALKTGAVKGVTTNPSLLSKEPKGNYLTHMKKIVDLVRRYGNASLSVEVFSDKPVEMIEQARDFMKQLEYPNLAIKIPISYQDQNYLEVVKQLSEENISVNCTACMTPMQLIAAAAAGAKYVSVFYNRIRDGAKETESEAIRAESLGPKAGIIEEKDFDPNNVISEARILLTDYPQAEIIAGSMRTPVDVKQAGLAGAHIVTAGYPIFQRMLKHFKTDHAVRQFLTDFQSWLS